MIVFLVSVAGVAAGDSSQPVFHTLHAVLWASDAHLVEVCTARKTHSFLLTASDW